MDVALMKTHVRNRILAAPLADSPFPHLVVDDLFPAEILSQIHHDWPTQEQVQTLGQLGRVAGTDYPSRKVTPFALLEKMLDAARLPFWRKMRDVLFSNEFNGALLQALKRPLDARAARQGAGKKAFAPDSLIVEDGEGYAISPHTDTPRRLLTVLIYLPEDRSMIQYGTSLYRPIVDMSGKNPDTHHPFEWFERATTVDFIPNRLIAFIRDDNTYHGVETVTAPPHPRRLLIHQLQEVQIEAPPAA